MYGDGCSASKFPVPYVYTYPGHPRGNLGWRPGYGLDLCAAWVPGLFVSSLYLALLLLDANEATVLDELDESRGLVFFVANAAGEVVAVAFLLPALAVLSKDWAVLPIPIPNEALFDRAALLLIELLLTRMPLPTMALVFMVVSAQLEMLLLPAETARMGLRIPILMVGSSRAARLLVVVVVMRALAARAGLVVRPSSLAMAVEPMPRSRGGGRAIVLAASVVTNARNDASADAYRSSKAASSLRWSLVEIEAPR